MAEEETAILNLLLEFFVVFTLVDVRITEVFCLLEDVVLYVIEEVFHVVNDAIEAYTVLFERVSAHNLNGIVLQITTTHRQTDWYSLQFIVCKLEAWALIVSIIILHCDAQCPQLVDNRL